MALGQVKNLRNGQIPLDLQFLWGPYGSDPCSGAIFQSLENTAYDIVKLGACRLAIAGGTKNYNDNIEVSRNTDVSSMTRM